MLVQNDERVTQHSGTCYNVIEKMQHQFVKATQNFYPLTPTAHLNCSMTTCSIFVMQKKTQRNRCIIKGDEGQKGKDNGVKTRIRRNGLQ
jgi:hypothetical protein